MEHYRIALVSDAGVTHFGEALDGLDVATRVAIRIADEISAGDAGDHGDVKWVNVERQGRIQISIGILSGEPLARTGQAHPARRED